MSQNEKTNMSTPTHTPLPWHITSSGRPIIITAESACKELPLKVCHVRQVGRETDANAAFIVQACNAHDDLVEALRKCKEAVENTNLPPSCRMELVRDYATPALAKAKGKA